MITVKKLNEKDKPSPSFPKLMINDNKEIFFFVRHGLGLPINGSNWDFYAKTWREDDVIMDGFTDYNEPITIQNT